MKKNSPLRGMEPQPAVLCPGAVRLNLALLEALLQIEKLLYLTKKLTFRSESQEACSKITCVH